MEKKWYPTASKGTEILMALAFGGFGLAFLAATIAAAMGEIPFTINERPIQDPSFAKLWPFIPISLLFIGFGGLLSMSAFVGAEISEEGISYIDYRRRRTTMWWSEVKSVRYRDRDCTLFAADRELTIGKVHHWSELKGQISKRTPGLAEQSAERPAAVRSPAVVDGLYRHGHLKLIRWLAIVAVLGSVAALVIGYRKSDMGIASFYLMGAVVGVVLAANCLAYFRVRVELKSDGLVYTPRFGRPVEIAYSQIRSLRFERVEKSEEVDENWEIDIGSGKPILVPVLANMDELIAIIANRMPESAKYIGPDTAKSDG